MLIIFKLELYWLNFKKAFVVYLIPQKVWIRKTRRVCFYTGNLNYYDFKENFFKNKFGRKTIHETKRRDGGCVLIV